MTLLEHVSAREGSPIQLPTATTFSHVCLLAAVLVMWNDLAVILAGMTCQ